MSSFILSLTIILFGIAMNANAEGAWQLRFIVGDHGDISISSELVITSQAGGLATVSWSNERPRERRDLWQRREIDFRQAGKLYESIIAMIAELSVKEQENWDIRDGSTLTIWVDHYARSKAVRLSHEAYRASPEVKAVLAELVELTGVESFERLTRPLDKLNGEQGGDGDAE